MPRFDGERSLTLVFSPALRIIGRIRDGCATRRLRRFCPGAQWAGSLSELTTDESGELQMALGTALFLIAVGAVLRFAVSVSTHGVSIHAIGDILMIVGGVGLILSLFWMMIWRQHASRSRYADRGDYAGRNAPPPPEAY